MAKISVSTLLQELSSVCDISSVDSTPTDDSLIHGATTFYAQTIGVMSLVVIHTAALWTVLV